VVHASVAWSRERLEADAREVAQLLLHEFAAATGIRLPVPIHLEAHRWRHALVQQPLGLPCLVDEESAAGACGDWCTAPRVEAAFDSGRALAHSLLPMVGLATPALLR
jgi:predicted NAD/FAD-dependent oxidoreductase